MAFLASMVPGLFASPLIRSAIGSLGSTLWSGVKNVAGGILGDLLGNAKSAGQSFVKQSLVDVKQQLKKPFVRMYNQLNEDDYEVDDQAEYVKMYKPTRRKRFKR